MRITVRQAAGAARARAHLGELARGGLSRELVAAVERGTRNADRYGDDAAEEYLPHRGGMAAYMARRLEVHRSRRGDGYRLTFDAKGTDAARINAGRLRRPLFGDREHWYTQTVRPGFGDEAIRRVKADVDREVREESRRLLSG